jgi:type I restriction enzyme S subunit
MRTLETLKICLPPLDQQAEIIDYLDQKCGGIDSLIQEKQDLISELEAYKRSLIYETVTGKRKVV